MPETTRDRCITPSFSPSTYHHGKLMDGEGSARPGNSLQQGKFRATGSERGGTAGPGRNSRARSREFSAAAQGTGAGASGIFAVAVDRRVKRSHTRGPDRVKVPHKYGVFSVATREGADQSDR